MDYKGLINQQRTYFKKGLTQSLNSRLELIGKLKTIIKEKEPLLCEAIAADFGKSPHETYTTELSFIYNEADYFLKHLKDLAQPEKVETNLVNLPGSSRIYREPFGVVLIIGAWNYPYQLSLVPVLSALAAGNTVLLKPSEIPERTALAMEKIINKNFSAKVLHVITGGVEETTALLKEQFDKIFFTGSPQVGKIVYKAAAEYLTPVTLELGGKSPAIITASADLKVAARRIVWGKFLNAGQTCTAPDYLYVHRKIEKPLLEEIKNQIEAAKYLPGTDQYTRIINERNFDRLTKLIDSDKVYYGGKTDRAQLYIEPTILQNADWNDPAMKEEIFGPILPVLTYTDFNQVLETIREHEKPLSAYLFSGDKKEKKAFSEQISFGGGCINDTIMHMVNPHLPFGGVGNSGMGSYHGKYGFETFSHQKAILERKTWGEPSLKYPPYTPSKKKWTKRIQ